MRLRSYSEAIPKPMVDIGCRPIIWHLMKYYAHFGHKDLVLCLGWKADYVKQYFLNYDECLSNDFVLSGGGKSVDLLKRDIDDWRITFVDTGVRSSIGQRLKAVREHVKDEETFLANYTDGLSDVDLQSLIDTHDARGATATFASVNPPQVFHAVEATEEGRVEDVAAVNELTWNTFRNHLILEYEIPKYEGDLGAPNVFMPIDEAVCRRKVDTIVEAFAPQQSRAWFDADTFWALLRIRGVECNSPSRFAEGLYGRKLTLTAAAGGALAAAPDLASVTADVT